MRGFDLSCYRPTCRATRTSHRLEWYIILLIAIEIGLGLYDRFLK
jgi:uncharacterized Rmd1/YagE family protein